MSHPHGSQEDPAFHGIDVDHYNKYPGEFVRVPDSVFSTPITSKTGYVLAKQYNTNHSQLNEELKNPVGKRVFKASRLLNRLITLEELQFGNLRELAQERKVRYCIFQKIWLNCTYGGKFPTTSSQGFSRRGSPQSSSLPNTATASRGTSAAASRGSSPGPASREGTPPADNGDSSSDCSESGDDGFHCDIPSSAVGPPPPPPPRASALLYVASASATSAAPSLRLLATVAAEQRCAGAGAGAGSPHPGLSSRLAPLPIPVLQAVLGTLSTARAALEAELISPQERAAAEAAAQLAHEQNNVLLYNVCLWQRRHPLDVVTYVLEMNRTGAIAAYLRDCGAEGRRVCEGVALPPSPVAAMDGLVEGLTAAAFPALARVPWLLRCDVLMTYPLMPVERQMAIMAQVAAHCPAAATAQGSSEPVLPRVMLAGHMAADAIPDRFAEGITTQQYRAIRTAVEQHKSDGVRRLCSYDYH